MTENTKTGLKIALGAFVLIGGSALGYYFYKRRTENELEDAAEKAVADAVTDSGTIVGGSSTPAPAPTPEPVTPFTNTTEGNAFRTWVNENYPGVAKKYDLDPQGSYDNVNIRNAYKELGAKYLEYLAKLAGQQAADKLVKAQQEKQKQLDEMYAKVLKQFKAGSKVYAKKTGYANNVYSTPFLSGTKITSFNPGDQMGVFVAPSTTKGWAKITTAFSNKTGYVPLTQIMANPY